MRRRSTSDPDQVRRASKVILPGVGAFADAIAELRRTGLGEAFVEAVRVGKPCLGVCLGLAAPLRRQRGGRRASGARPDPGPGRPVRARAGPEGPPHGLEYPAGPQALAAPGRARARARRSTSSTPTTPGPTTPADVVAESDHPRPFAAMVGRDNLIGHAVPPREVPARRPGDVRQLRPALILGSEREPERVEHVRVRSPRS